MTENSDKVPIALVGPDDVEFCSPPVSIARGPQSGYRVGPYAGPGLRVGVRIPYPGSGICATKCGSGSKLGRPNVCGMMPTRVRVQIVQDFQTGVKGRMERKSKWGGPVAGGECRSVGRWPYMAQVAYPTSTPEYQGPVGENAAKGGASRSSGRAVPHPHSLLPGSTARRTEGDRRRRHDLSLSWPRPQAYATVTVKPSSHVRLLRVGAVVLISGAVLLLFGAIGAFYFWKGSDNHVSPGVWGWCPGLGGARGQEVRGVAGSSLSCTCSPLGGARALVREGPALCNPRTLQSQLPLFL